MKCNGNKGTDFGTWEATQTPANPENYDEIGAGTEGVLSEHECRGGESPATLVIGDIGSGADLSCENPPEHDDVNETYTVAAPNKCVLLCDYHLVMVFEGRLNDEGEFKFYDSNTGDVIDDGSVIKCWP